MPAEAYVVNVRFLIAENPSATEPVDDIKKRVMNAIESLDPFGKVDFDITESNLWAAEQVVGDENDPGYDPVRSKVSLKPLTGRIPSSNAYRVVD